VRSEREKQVVIQKGWCLKADIRSAYRKKKECPHPSPNNSVSGGGKRRGREEKQGFVSEEQKRNK